MKKLFLMLALASLALVACNKDDGEDTQPQQKIITIHAMVNFSNPATRVAPNTKDLDGEGNVDFHWEEGDQVTISNSSGSSTFTVVANSIMGNVADFKGEELTDMSSYTVTYNSNATEVEYAEGTFKPACSGNGDSKGFTIDTFQPVLKLQLSGDATLGKIEYCLDSEDATTTITFSEGLKLTNTVQAVYFLVTASSNNGFTIKFYDNTTNNHVITTQTATNDVSTNTICIFPELSVKHDYEADIGSTYYSTLAKAITDANNTSNATIELLKNVTVDDTTLSISASMTIDMGGFSITCSKPIQSATTFPFLVETDGITLKFKNGVFIDGADTNEFDSFIAGASLGLFGGVTYTLNLTDVDFGVFDASGSCTATFRTKGNCTLLSGIANATFTNVRVGTTYSVIDNSSYGTGSVTVKGCKYVVNGYNANGNFGFYFADGTNSFEDVTIDVTSTVAGSSCICGPATLKNCNFTSNQCAVRLTLGSDITIDGGTYHGDVAAVKNEQGTVAINSGTLTSAGNTIQTEGYYDSLDPHYAIIYVNDGQFKGAIAKKVADMYNTIELKGGIYSADPADYVASGYKKITNTDPATSTEYPNKVTKE